ncbi:hypothetical protein BGZ89_003312 [Linnemannia elongata]|nr:hypothetical protein BGZ89_003312 [Linnemannia elongata]
MEETQSFRLIGNKDIEKILCDHIDEQNIIYWEDIEQLFPGVKQVKNGEITVSMLRDSSRKRIIPHCIKHYPGVVLDVILTATVGNDNVNPISPANAPTTDAAANPRANPSASSLTNPPATAPTAIPPTDAPANGLANPPIDAPVNLHAPANAAIDASTNSPANAPTNPPVDARANLPTSSQTNNQPNTCPSGAIIDVLLANPPSSSSAKGSGRISPVAVSEPVSSLAIATKTSDDHSSTGPCQVFQSAVIHKLDALHDQGAVTQQIAQKVLQLSEEMKARLILIQSKTEAILNQQLELAEYPIPRLFIVLPEELTKYDPSNWFRTKFRLHFICECGKHTEPSNSKVLHYIIHCLIRFGYFYVRETGYVKSSTALAKIALLSR